MAYYRQKFFILDGEIVEGEKEVERRTDLSIVSAFLEGRVKVLKPYREIVEKLVVNADADK